MHVYETRRFEKCTLKPECELAGRCFVRILSRSALCSVKAPSKIRRNIKQRSTVTMDMHAQTWSLEEIEAILLLVTLSECET